MFLNPDFEEYRKTLTKTINWFGISFSFGKAVKAGQLAK